jgi:hypothetical protein
MLSEREMGMSMMAISVSFRDGVVAINAIAGRTLAFLGASCPASAIPGNDGLSSVTLSPNKGEDAVVALATFFDPGGKNKEIREGGLVRLYWEGDKLIVDTDKLFISPADRLGQVVPSGRILQVTTRGQTFAMSTADDKYRNMYEEPLTVRGARIVNDANLLCRYLVGQATFEELEAVASGDLRTAERIQFESQYQALLDRSLADLESAKEEVKRLEARSVRDEETLKTKNGQIMGLLEGIDTFRAEISRSAQVHMDLYQEAGDMRIRLEKEIGQLKNQLNQTLGAKWRRFCQKLGLVPYKPGCSRSKGC